MSDVHASPFDGSEITRCCARTLAELDEDDRITSVVDNVTCLGRQRTKGKPRTPCAQWVAGIWINCCERGETDCPCMCHDEQSSKENRA